MNSSEPPTPTSAFDCAATWLKNRWNLPDSALPILRQWALAVSQGSTALALDKVPAEPWGDALALADPHQPPPAPRPLVALRLPQGCLLQSWKHYRAERDIASRIKDLLRDSPSPSSHPPMAESLKLLLPGSSPEDPSWRAVQTSVSRRFTLITGGPGSGKTWTLARILAHLCQCAHAAGETPPRVRLAAPTGKATDRMRESVRESFQSLPPSCDPIRPHLIAMASQASTLHALLGYNPALGSCRYNALNPLPCDTLIVDESSMVDLLTWQALFHALADTRHLILIGDPNQLESVAEGSVLGAWTSIARCHAGFRASWLHLPGTRRFAHRPGIQTLADAIEAGHAARAVEHLRRSRQAPDPQDLSWLGPVPRLFSWENLPPSIQTAILRVADAESPSEALSAVSQVRILAANREGPGGAKAVGHAIAHHLARRAEIEHRSSPVFPIIIDRNDPETGLRNGSVGIVRPEPGMHSRAWFPNPDGTGEAIDLALSRLPEFSQAWALTIHRAQGSEFSDILVLLPRPGSPLATRELLYTALTRARTSIHLLGDLETVAEAVTRPARRVSALAHYFPDSGP